MITQFDSSATPAGRDALSASVHRHRPSRFQTATGWL